MWNFVFSMQKTSFWKTNLGHGVDHRDGRIAGGVVVQRVIDPRKVVNFAPTRRAAGRRDLVYVDLQLVGVRDEVLQRLGGVVGADRVELRAAGVHLVRREHAAGGVQGQRAVRRGVDELLLRRKEGARLGGVRAVVEVLRGHEAVCAAAALSFFERRRKLNLHLQPTLM